ncbi:hypothetical protein [Microbispora sp. NPDC049633]|uniref:hypothetical protein n=1 Tax=Microbispora sp. NPDC049633 TaxID=3154355 RepID=UPI003413136D
MTMPTPPAPDAGQPAAPPASPAAPAQAPTAPTAPAPTPQPPTAPPVPQPPTWTPPQPPQQDDDAEFGKLPQWAQKKWREDRQEAAKYRVQARTETVLRHAYTTATHHGVNPDALLGSVAFAEHAKSLDPSAEDFPAKLAEAIQNALTTNPWMAAQQAAATPPPPPVPTAGGADFQGAGGTPPPSLDEQIAEAEKAGNHALAISLKRQRAYST